MSNTKKIVGALAIATLLVILGAVLPPKTVAEAASVSQCTADANKAYKECNLFWHDSWYCGHLYFNDINRCVYGVSTHEEECQINATVDYYQCVADGVKPLYECGQDFHDDFWTCTTLHYPDEPEDPVN